METWEQEHYRLTGNRFPASYLIEVVGDPNPRKVTFIRPVMDMRGEYMYLIDRDGRLYNFSTIVWMQRRTQITNG